MPDTILAVVFKTELDAFKGVSALKDLNTKGDLTLYDHAVLAKDKSGQVNVVQATDEGPVGAATGLLFGGLVGMLAGPVGMVLGMAGGAAAGSIGDLGVADFDLTVLEDVANAMKNGNSVLVADIFEGWQVPVDDTMKALGGTVHRRLRVNVADEQEQRRVEAAKADWEEMKAEAQQASAEAKAALQAKVDAAGAALKKAGDDAKAKWDAMEADAKARVDALEVQIKAASDETKAKYEKRVAEIKTDLAIRKEKLGKAVDLAKDALSA